MLKTLVQKGLFHLLSANFLIQFLGFGTLMLIPRFVSAEELGTIKILQSYTALFLIFAGFGFQTSVLKLCAEERPDAERAYFLKVALLRSLGTTVIAYVLMAGLAYAGLIAPSSDVAFWMMVYALILPFNMATLLFSNYLQALKQIKEMARAQMVVKLQSVGIVLLATWQFGFKGFILSTLFGFAIGLWPFLRQIGLAFLKARAERPLPKLFMSIAVFGVLANGVHTLGNYADIYILSLFHTDDAEIGYYSVATYFLLGASIVTGTLQNISVPFFSEKAQDEAWFRRNLLRMQLQTAGISVVVAAGVRVAAWVVITYLYDPAYAVALHYLDILLIKYVLWSSFAIIGISMISLGVPKYNFYGACLTTPVGLALSYFFLKYRGMEGIAWAQVVTAAFTLVMLLLLIRYVLKVYYRDPVVKQSAEN